MKLRREVNLVIIFALLLGSCAKKNEIHEIELSVSSIQISVFEYVINKELETVNWYYPDEVIFNIKVENKSNDTLIFGAFERKNHSNKWGRLRIEYKNDEYKLVTNSQGSWLYPNDSSYLTIAAKNSDLFFFKTIYSKNKFEDLFIDFINNAILRYEPITDDYSFELGDKTSLYKYCNNSTIFHIDKDVCVKITAPNKPDLTILLNEIGFPFDTIPKQIKIHEPIDEFNY